MNARTTALFDARTAPRGMHGEVSTLVRHADGAGRERTGAQDAWAIAAAANPAGWQARMRRWGGRPW